MVHEPGGINGDEFGVVSDEGEVVRGGELDGPAVPAVDDFDLKRLGEDKCGRKRRIWKRLIMMIELADVCVRILLIVVGGYDQVCQWRVAPMKTT